MPGAVTNKTNAVRLLEGLGVAFELRAYEVDEEDLTAETVARKVGLPLEQVWKTLIVCGDRTGPLFAAIPGDVQLDPRALARLSGDKLVEMVPLEQVTPLTGYVRGGVTALAGKKDYPVFADETIVLHDLISISAGRRGLQVLLAPADYVRAVRATLGPITRA